MNCIDLMSKTSNNAKLQKWSNYDEVHGFDVKANKNVLLRRKPLKTTQIYKSYQSTMKCMDLTSKRTKILSYVANHSKQRKSKKEIKIQWIASIWCQNDKNVELRPKPFKTTQTYKSIQITMNCIDLMSITSNNAKLQKWSNYDEVHGFDVKTNKNVLLRRKPFKTTQIYKSYQSTMKCMDLTSERTKMLSYVANHSKQRKSKKLIKIQWIASIWRKNEQKCWVTSQTIQNNANLKR